MKKYTTLLAYIIIVGLSILTIAQTLKISSYNDRINAFSDKVYKLEHKLNGDSTFIFKQAIKEDYYIQQLDRNTELLLGVIGVLFTLFGLISFFNIEHRLKSYEIEQRQKHDDHLKNYQKLHRAIDIEFTSINAERATSYREVAGRNFGSNDTIAGIFNLALSLRHAAEWFVGTERNHPEQLSIVLISLRIAVNEILGAMIQHGTAHPIFIDKDFRDLIDNLITKVGDKEVRINCAKIVERLPPIPEISQ